MGIKINPGNTLTEQVMTHVRGAIRDGSMTTDEWYSVYQLSDQLGVSRSPVREALLRLEEAGLVKFVRNRGFQVRHTTPDDVAEIFALRLAIEPAAAGRAALNRSDDQLEEMQKILNLMKAEAASNNSEAFFDYDQAFHGLILTAGKSSRGRDYIDRLRTNTRIINVSTAGTMRTLHEIHLEHFPIYSAIEKKNRNDAAAAMFTHVETTGLLLLHQSMPNSESKEIMKLWQTYTS